MPAHYAYTFSTILDRGIRLPQTTAQTARNACPIGASLYRLNKGAPQYLGYRRDAMRFVRVGE